MHPTTASQVQPKHHPNPHPSLPGKTIEQAQLADLFHQLHAKQQKIAFLEFEKQKSTSDLQLNCDKTLSEQKENNKKLHEDVIALQTGIKEKDDCYHKVVMARNSLQTEVDNLNKKTKELQGEKDELIQQRKQLQEDAENNLITAREAHDRDRDSSRKIEEYQRHENKQNKIIQK
jgi:hypothetical protein